MNKHEYCDLCNSNIQINQLHDDSFRIICPNCGTYNLSRKDLDDLKHYVEENNNVKHLISGYLREMSDVGHQVGMIKSDNLTPLYDNPIVPKTTQERINKLLLHIYRSSQELGKELTFDENWKPALGYAKNTNELKFMMDTLVNYGFIKMSMDKYGHFGCFKFFLLPRGFTVCEELLNQQIKQRVQVFVAMAFTSEMMNILDASIRPAALECGFEAFIVSDEEHNESINDKIIAGIKESRFIIADFTGQRGGVYFEAGLAQGLGLLVIKTCKEDEVVKLHFDVRQYNFILWNNADDLKEKLINRIKATIL